MSDKTLKGVYPPLDFADDIETMRETGLPRGFEIGWRTFDPLYTVPRGQWTVVTGLSGSGKSTWLDNVLVALANRHGWKFLVCSPENQPIKRHIAGLMQIVSGKKFGRPNAERFPNVPVDAFMTDEEHREAYLFVCKHFHFINPPDTEFTIDGIIAIAEELHANQFQFDGMVLDPYNEIEHKRPSGMSETDYISTVLQKFRNFTRQLDIHFWFVAHPTKPVRMSVRYQKSELELSDRKPIYQKIGLFDIGGSSHWKSKCDFGIIVHRDMGDNTSPSLIEVEKIRFPEMGMIGEIPMYYDYLCGRFVEYYDQLLYSRLKYEHH